MGFSYFIDKGYSRRVSFFAARTINGIEDAVYLARRMEITWQEFHQIQLALEEEVDALGSNNDC